MPTNEPGRPADTRQAIPRALLHVLGHLAGRAYWQLRHSPLTGVFIGIIVVCIYLWASEPVFMTWGNWENIIRSNAIVAIVAIGSTLVILTGGFDLSAASITAAAAVFMGLAFQDGLGWPLAVLVALGAGFAMGFGNGFLIGVVKIPFIIVTIATLAIYQSVALVASKTGQVISLDGNSDFEPLATFVNGNVGPIPTILFPTVCLYLIGSVVLGFTSFGHSVYAVGSNPEAARLVGIRVTAVLVAVYTTAGLMSGAGAVAQTGRLTGALTPGDPTLLLAAIVAALIGGAAVTGGEGTLYGTAVGVLFLGLIKNGMSLQGIDAFWQGLLSGCLLIGVVGIGVARQYGWKLRRFKPRKAFAEVVARLAVVRDAARALQRPATTSAVSTAEVDLASQVEVQSARPLRDSLQRVSLARVMTGPVFGVVVVSAYLWATEPIFMTPANWRNIVLSQAVVALLAAGQTIVVLTRGLDFSMGSMTALSGVVFGIAIVSGWGWPQAALASVAVGAALGLFNGLLIGIARIPFFIVTLGTLAIFETLSLLISNEGQSSSLLGYPAFESFYELVNGSVWKIPTLFLIVAGLYVLGAILLRLTAFGRGVYAVGSNPEAASLAGINVRFVLVAAYTISGVFAALGAVVLAGRLASTAPQTDPNILFGVLAAVLIGGTTLAGGDGNLLRTAVGVLLFGVIQDGLLLRGVSIFWQGTVTGLILLGAVAIGILRARWVSARQPEFTRIAPARSRASA